MAASSIPEPTLVLYKSSMCKHCQNLTNIWDSVKIALTGVYPKLRFYEVTAKDNSGRFDENTVPKDLIRYSRWYPMIILVPGKIWDAAMANIGLGSRNPSEIRDGVQVMNAKWISDKIEYEQKYDIRNPSEFARWLRDAMNNPDFKRVQNEPAQVAASAVASAGASSIQPIAPLMSNIVRPSGSHVVPSSSSSKASVAEVEGDVCRMKIISRPR
jgi:hypothetical protein